MMPIARLILLGLALLIAIPRSIETVANFKAGADLLASAGTLRP